LSQTQAFEQVMQVQGPIRQVIASVVNNRHDVEDVFQEFCCYWLDNELPVGVQSVDEYLVGAAKKFAKESIRNISRARRRDNRAAACLMSDSWHRKALGGSDPDPNQPKTKYHTVGEWKYLKPKPSLAAEVWGYVTMHREQTPPKPVDHTAPMWIEEAEDLQWLNKHWPAQ